MKRSVDIIMVPSRKNFENIDVVKIIKSRIHFLFVTFNESSKEKWSKEDQTWKRADNFQTFPAEGRAKADGRRLVVT